MSTNFCTNCGFQRQDGFKYCAGCGSEFIEKRMCPTCGQHWPEVADVIAADSGVDGANSEPVAGLVYGASFDEDKDCSNCGAPGGKFSCPLCG